MKYVIGVDIGGTKIYSGLFRKGKLIKVLKFRAEAGRGKKKVIENINKSVECILDGIKKSDVKGIGVASPGPLNYKTGEIITTPNLPISGVNLKKILERKFGLKTRVDNDAKCAGLAESRERKGENFIFLTLGTGLGSCMVYNGEIFRGEMFATEFGHHTINFNGPRCGCGRRGCLESYTNSSAVLRYARERGLKEDAYEIQKKALNGNEKYKKVYEELGKYLGIGIANIANSLDINIFVIGGGIGNAFNLFVKTALAEARRRVLVRRDLKIEKSKVGEFASLIGAGYLI